MDILPSTGNGTRLGVVIMIEEKEIVGKLLAGGEAFDMLDLYPHRHASMPWLLREHTFEFLVVVNGVAQPIIVSRDNLVIIPYLVPQKKNVEYMVEEKEEPELEQLDNDVVPNHFTA